MRNLAGRPECDKYIRRELERARIPAEQKRTLARNSEVPYSVVGQLGSITFKRAWTYWVADGLVPLETAEDLYSDPVGRTDIRVSGHVGAPAPGEFAEWITPDGKQVLPAALEAEHQAVLEEYSDILPARLYSDRPEELDASQFISTYHIDTEVGLRVFADTLRTRALAEEPVQV